MAIFLMAISDIPGKHSLFLWTKDCDLTLHFLSFIFLKQSLCHCYTQRPPDLNYTRSVKAMVLSKMSEIRCDENARNFVEMFCWNWRKYCFVESSVESVGDHSDTVLGLWDMSKIYYDRLINWVKIWLTDDPFVYQLFLNLSFDYWLIN